MKVGIYLPRLGSAGAAGVAGPGGAGSIAAPARHADEVGLESVWIGDHLIPVVPILDSTVVAATVAAVTERVKIGFGVLILALRPVAWAAKQIASLQHLSGGRILLGVGLGGEMHGDAGWRAVGVPYAERGPRTDAALEVLPGLVTGEPTLVDGERVTLAPGAPMPPVLIAGGGPAALQRAARYGDEWYPAFLPPARIFTAARELAELAAAYGRSTPEITVNATVGLGDLPPSVVEDGVRSLTAPRMSDDEARRALITGDPVRAAERLAELAASGVGRDIAFPFTEDRFRQAELLAEAAQLVAEPLSRQNPL